MSRDPLPFRLPKQTEVGGVAEGAKRLQTVVDQGASDERGPPHRGEGYGEAQDEAKPVTPSPGCP